MATLKEEAQGYSPSQTRNIADLDRVSVSQPIFKEVRKNNNGEEYKISYIRIGNEEYRVPNSVLEQLQAILSENQNLSVFKVVKKGEGLKTAYTVVPLE